MIVSSVSYIYVVCVLTYFLTYLLTKIRLLTILSVFSSHVYLRLFVSVLLNDIWSVHDTPGLIGGSSRLCVPEVTLPFPPFSTLITM